MRQFFVLLSVFVGILSMANAQSKEPDLSKLSESGFIVGPGNSAYPVSQHWQRFTKVMQFSETFDRTVKEIENTVCGAEQNKGVLLVGEANEFYKYILARLATRPGSPCEGLWKVDIDMQKIEAGHMYVGQVDEYWREEILEPSDNKNVILYLGSLNGLIGLGAHSNDDTGIEREYAANITAGQIRTVAFMDKFNYNETIRSKHAYVLESFATKLILPPVTSEQAGELLQIYLQALYPQMILGKDEMNYLLKMGAYYMPNRPEPERSMAIINHLVRAVGDSGRELKNNTVTIETAHPYLNNTTQTWEVSYPDAKELQLVFDSFDVENNYDKLVVEDANGKVLETLSGNKGGFRTNFYPTNKVVLKFTADNDGQRNGFKISTVVGAKYKEHRFTFEETRFSVMTVAQVPEWLIKRDYSVIRELKGKLDGDVVGVREGKEDVVRMAKNGYVAGRTDEKPVATLLFAGPTGTGKSYLAKRFADFTGQPLITMDMTSYKEPSSFRTFQEVLARHLTNTPYAVYLFEEIDKASVEILDQLYFMMDEGVFYDQHQRPLFARGAFILMTTNAASDVILSNPKSPDLRKLVMEDLEKHFRMSFLNRFDAVPIFLPFSDEEYLQLAHVLADKKMSKIAEFYDWSMKSEEAVYQYIATFGKSPKFGARPMERLVEAVLGGGIAEFQLNSGIIPQKAKLQLTKLPGVHSFRLKVNDKTVDFEVNPSNNSLMAAPMSPRIPEKLQKLFEANRDYLD